MPGASALCYMSCELWAQSCGAACVLNSLLVIYFLFFVDRFIVWCAVAVYHTYVTGSEEVFHLRAQCIIEV